MHYAPKTAATVQLTTPSDRQIVLTRTFDAPRHLVFQALTTPELLKRWYGPPDWPLTHCEIDLRVGGAWRYVSHGPDGEEMVMLGVYREIVPPDRLVTTERFEGSEHPGESIVTTTLVERDGKTTLTIDVLYPSRQVRDAILRTNMAQGVTASFNRLAEYLATVV